MRCVWGVGGGCVGEGTGEKEERAIVVRYFVPG